MSSFIPVTPGTIGKIQCLTVDGRALHGVLGVRRDFATWMKNRIAKYGFSEGMDYEKIVNDSSSPKLGSLPVNGFQAAIEYRLALDMGKELCMVENNEKGRIARRYFIECERKLMAELANPKAIPFKQPELPPAKPTLHDKWLENFEAYHKAEQAMRPDWEKFWRDSVELGHQEKGYKRNILYVLAELLFVQSKITFTVNSVSRTAKEWVK